MKFLGIEFGSLVEYKEKGTETTTIIRGNIPYGEMKASLDKFIEKYILCPSCSYPEMVLRVK